MPFLRDDFEGLKARIARGYGSGEQATTFVGMVTIGGDDGDGGTVNQFFGVSPTTVDGTEAEGAAARFVADLSTTIYAYNLGGQVPPMGAMVIVESVTNRWVFSYG